MTVRAELTSPSRHPLAGQTMTGADMVIQVLADEGVEIVFGYSGGGVSTQRGAAWRFKVEKGYERRKPVEFVVSSQEPGAGLLGGWFFPSHGGGRGDGLGGRA